MRAMMDDHHPYTVQERFWQFWVRSSGFWSRSRNLFSKSFIFEYVRFWKEGTLILYTMHWRPKLSFFRITRSSSGHMRSRLGHKLFKKLLRVCQNYRYAEFPGQFILEFRVRKYRSRSLDMGPCIFPPPQPNFHSIQPRHGWAPDPPMVGIRSPIGLVVGSCTSHPGVLGSIPKREEPGKTGAPCV
jgi:hypothetical protein